MFDTDLDRMRTCVDVLIWVFQSADRFLYLSTSRETRNLISKRVN